MTTTTNTNTYKKIAHAFTDYLALSGWAIALVIFAAALFPEFSRQLEQYGVYLLDEFEALVSTILS